MFEKYIKFNTEFKFTDWATKIRGGLTGFSLDKRERVHRFLDGYFREEETFFILLGFGYELLDCLIRQVNEENPKDPDKRLLELLDSAERRPSSEIELLLNQIPTSYIKWVLIDNQIVINPPDPPERDPAHIAEILKESPKLERDREVCRSAIARAKRRDPGNPFVSDVEAKFIKFGCLTTKQLLFLGNVTRTFSKDEELMVEREKRKQDIIKQHLSLINSLLEVWPECKMARDFKDFLKKRQYLTEDQVESLKKIYKNQTNSEYLSV